MKMKNKHTKNTTCDESLLDYASTTLVPITKPAVNDSHSETRQDITEAEDNGQDKPEKRERVYLHSIGRFSKLKKLQKGAYKD